MSVDLSVVIVTWNSRDDVVRCLASLRRSTLSLQVVVVDNGSTDGTLDAVRAAHPEAHVVHGHGNVGFPAANNLGLRHVTGRHVLFLNPDTEVGEGTLEACVAALDADPAIGVVGCRLVNPDGSVQYECARNAYLLRDLAAESLWLHMLFPRSALFSHCLMGDWDHLDDRDVEAVSGAFMMARRAVVAAVGGLPEDVFMYHEDMSFCLRVRRAGWRIRYLAGPVTTHFSGRSSSQSSAPLYLLEGEYKLRFIAEAEGPAYAAAGRVLFAARSAARLVIAVGMLLLPRLRRRYPAVADARRHALQLVWSIAPFLLRNRIPAAVSAARSGLPEVA